MIDLGNLTLQTAATRAGATHLDNDNLKHCGTPMRTTNNLDTGDTINYRCHHCGLQITRIDAELAAPPPAATHRALTTGECWTIHLNPAQPGMNRT